MAHSGVLYISEWGRGHQTSRGSGVTYSLPSTLNGPDDVIS